MPLVQPMVAALGLVCRGLSRWERGILAVRRGRGRKVQIRGIEPTGEPGSQNQPGWANRPAALSQEQSIAISQRILHPCDAPSLRSRVC
jgi:hypothetical protein